ncbi:MAG: general secretion pathway protein D [Halioglobus sp.]|jgi:general secretion pathway protein D
MNRKISRKVTHAGLLGRWVFLVPACLSVLLSCASNSTNSDKNGSSAQMTAVSQSEGGANPQSDAVAGTALSSSATDLAQTVTSTDKSLPILYKGNDKQINVPPAREPIKFIGDDVSLNFEQAPLEEVMHAIMGDMLGLDYIVDNPVKGTVTLRTRTPVPRDQVFSILESLLKANKVLMIRGKDNRFLITGSAQATKLSPGLSDAKNPGLGYSTIVAPLQFISASNMAEILKPLADESAFVRVDNTRNLLMLAGTGAQLDGWMDIILTFDVDILAGMSVGMFPLENTSVDEMNEILSGLLGKNGAVADLASLVRIIPIDRLNSILVVTPRAHYLDRVGKWITRLDGVPQSSFEKRLYVYPVQNTSAGRLAELLSKVYVGSGSGGSRGGGSPSSAGGGSSGGGDVAPGLSAEKIGASSGGSSSAAAPASFPNSSSGGGTSDFSLNGVKVVADDDNNALMIYATGKEYSKIEVALEQLDVVATQVIIEASILEVSLTDEMQYGVEWTFDNNLNNGREGVGVLAAAAGGPAAAVPGFSYTITDVLGSGNIDAVLNALAAKSLINVISTPSVMVLDNNVAYIHVGDSVPVNAGNTVTNNGVVVQNITYRDTGVELTVKPSVNAGGLVTLDVDQSVTDIGTIDAATGQRSFLERNISSRVAVRSGESIVLGGLIRENATEGKSGVPFLYTLPLIGPLFGSTTTESRRTELLVIITPRAIYDESELRDVSEEMRSHIRHMDLIDAPPR